MEGITTIELAQKLNLSIQTVLNHKAITLRLIQKYQEKKEKEFKESVKDSAIIEEVKILETASELLIQAIHKNHSELWNITPRQFEELIAEILHKMDFEVTLTPQSHDGGTDIIVKSKTIITEFTWFVECKHFARERPVGIGVFREVLGTHHMHHPNKSIIVASSYFSKEVIKKAEEFKPLIDLNDHKAIFSWVDLVS